ncbi:hypothetical protein [Thiothrix fructosivorans]|uniref:Uncharacterized protein n=1 Tax=Thiothrix fructosivorans TaxID=111770 RepID=A0A8B0SPD5_9GAMM|nr:hypothetical protein [Thiothrix fructosivorans]MBO0612642.1 hypothetical protein [Thiothrix fructosivorans]QTX11888.1 hypothetical protein J1836_006000 [Thiothrix fructosivorans]
MFSFQGTKQPLVTVCRRHGGYTLLAMSMVVITGCGGGGSNVSDPIDPSGNTTSTVTPEPTVVVNTDTTPLNPLYTGKRELATLTEAAALDFLKLGRVMSSNALEVTPIVLLMNTPLMFSDTANCQISGKISRTAKESVSDDGLATTYLSQYTYDQCQSESAIINGSSGFTRVETYGPPKTLTETDNIDVTVVNPIDKIIDVYNGSASLNITGVKLSKNQNTYVKEKNVEILKVNLQQLGAGNREQGSITEMDGRIYIGNYGYITPKVLQPLYFTIGSIHAGELIMNGANNTKAQVLPTSSTTFVLNTDENGDGAYEKTRIVNWADL